ncbi:iron complex outermembrane receptor protein [Lacinutrix venerupis]|uniref:TonB-dependent receptor plug domain-containing protein n=1 Tax=Lacinutrix venerupis TaxID=1486034 RepID=UPI000F28DE0E|nr:TonB-dependent receptor [Lacinutrix venerupis]RLJ62504.1 iron complex outermembrane receptor protein [Lacinutrix venerupis]
MKKSILILFTIICSLSCLAQTKLDSIQNLDEVILSDSKLKTFTNTQSVLKITDSVIKKQNALLTHLLNSNTPIYFKENGYGMVSSASFRGTTAQQTAVVWNGININSQLNGQTDFSTVNTEIFDNIDVRSGGGSVLYGSGAIGGSVHLNNEIRYNNENTNYISTSFGSFSTINTTYKGHYSTSKLSVNANVSYLQSENDYDYVDSNRSNLNGAFYSNNFGLNLGYKINDNNILKVYSSFYDGQRHFALQTSTETPSKYKNRDTRNLIEYVGLTDKFTSKLKVAYITENYKYFSNIARDTYTDGDVNSLILKYDLSYKLDDNITINPVIDYTQNSGKGSSINKVKRDVTGFNLLYKHNIGERFLYEITTRQEITNNYNSPLLYSLGLKYSFSDLYTLSINGSKNYRVPTFNDLYWQDGGNLNLKPENSYQIEIGNVFTYKNLDLSLTGYYNDIKDMIRWLPTGTIWMPINTDHVKTYGIETALNVKQSFGENHLSLSSTYAYTVSEDQERETQLIYVPYHKATATLSYNYKRLSAYYQQLYVGEVFTQSDNNKKYNIDAYYLSHFGVDYTFGSNKNFRLGAQVNNIFNHNYQSVLGRFMPGTHFNTYLNFNF